MTHPFEIRDELTVDATPASYHRGQNVNKNVDGCSSGQAISCA